MLGSVVLDIGDFRISRSPIPSFLLFSATQSLMLERLNIIT